MSNQQKQDKIDKRAAALRENLKKRKALAKGKDSSADNPEDDKDK